MAYRRAGARIDDEAEPLVLGDVGPFVLLVGARARLARRFALFAAAALSLGLGYLLSGRVVVLCVREEGSPALCVAEGGFPFAKERRQVLARSVRAVDTESDSASHYLDLGGPPLLHSDDGASVRHAAARIAEFDRSSRPGDRLEVSYRVDYRFLGPIGAITIAIVFWMSRFGRKQPTTARFVVDEASGELSVVVRSEVGTVGSSSLRLTDEPVVDLVDVEVGETTEKALRVRSGKRELVGPAPRPREVEALTRSLRGLLAGYWGRRPRPPVTPSEAPASTSARAGEAARARDARDARDVGPPPAKAGKKRGKRRG
jgi:hypothetical protein